MRTLLAGIIACGVLATSASAQQSDSTGTVDTRPSVRAQIERLERLTSGDIGPDKMTVYLRWLADLYTGTGDLDGAQGAYQRILVLDPYDLGSSNLLAMFLLDQRKKPDDALELLDQTIGWASQAQPPPLYLGQTYALQARALRELGRYDEALAASDRATERLDPDAAEDALRTQAVSLKELGKRDDAEKAFVHLIGVTGGSNADDINALIALETAKKGSIDAGQLRAQVKKTIDDARHEREEYLRHDGAEMIVLEGEGHVRLEGTLRRGKGKNAVLFVPDLGGRRSAYTPYAQLLALDGVTTFAIDPRGHGDSRCDSLPSFLELSLDHRERIASDIAAARRYLTDTLKFPVNRIAVVVAGAASTDVEDAMHGQNLDTIVVHLSPVFDPLDRDVASAIAFRPPRPALVMVSEEDMYSVQSVNAMQAAQPDHPITVRTVRSSGHGVTLLHRPENFAVITEWLDGQFGTEPASR
ncbi:MAG TPA: tetratricopeptide repeat protein [Candidatus Krumholzibacteria bacterium]